MKKILITCALLVAVNNLSAEAEKNGPKFYFGFESFEELKEVGGIAGPKARIITGMKGNAFKIPKGFPLYFPAGKAIPESEGTFSVWIRPSWDYKDKKLLVFRVLNLEQKNPSLLFNCFEIFGSWYGVPKKDMPCKLFTLRRESQNKQQKLLVDQAPWKKDAWQHLCVSWSTGSETKQGELKMYLDGKLIGRKNALKPVRIELGEKLSCTPEGDLDELKVWNRVLSPEEVMAEYSSVNN